MFHVKDKDAGVLRRVQSLSHAEKNINRGLFSLVFFLFFFSFTQIFLNFKIPLFFLNITWRLVRGIVNI